MPEKADHGPDNCLNVSSSVAKPTLLLHPSTKTGGSSKTVTLSSTHPTTMGPQHNSSQCKIPDNRFSKSLRDHLTDLGFSEWAAHCKLQGFQVSSTKAYSHGIKRWNQFCDKHKVSPVHPNLPESADFFAHLLQETEFKQDTLISIRASLGWVLDEESTKYLSSKHISKIIHAAHLNRPSLPRLKANIWNPEVVLDLLKTWQDTDLLDLMDLSRKTVTLIALATMRRIVDLTRISLHPRYFHRSP